ncbi:MAG: type II toxin-antitoxin system RelE/ParE family toxin [Thermomicrobiales bacterium]
MTSSTDLVVTWQARQDIEDIYRYTLEQWGEVQAEIYDEMLHRAFLLLRDFPEMGLALSPDGDVREHYLRHHTIVYRYDGATVTIVVIVSPRRMRR